MPLLALLLQMLRHCSGDGGRLLMLMMVVVAVEDFVRVFSVYEVPLWISSILPDCTSELTLPHTPNPKI